MRENGIKVRKKEWLIQRERERERGGGWGLDENIKLTECEK